LRQPPILDGIEEALRLGQARRLRFLTSGHGRDATYDVVAAPVEGLGVLLSFEDVTDREKAGQMRRDFVANVSHELKTPLTALLGFIETLRGAARDDPAARERFLGIMQPEAERMNRLVRDLLSLSRVESEERLRPSGQADVAALVRSAIQTLRPVAEDADVSIALTGAGSAICVPGDA
ncbi:two-component sensor histidine kinase, partial [Escherichia coli]|nr:two-component sensor histidine kinase [Escherichia coli]